MKIGETASTKNEVKKIKDFNLEEIIQALEQRAEQLEIDFRNFLAADDFHESFGISNFSQQMNKNLTHIFNYNVSAYEKITFVCRIIEAYLKHDNQLIKRLKELEKDHDRLKKELEKLENIKN